MAKEQKSVGELKGLADLSAGLGHLTADQVRGAVDMYFDYLQRTVAAAPSGGTEFGRLKDCAEKNITMTHEFVRRLSHAKDLQEMLSVQIEYMQTLANAFGQQTKNLTEAYAKTAAGAVKNPLSGIS